MTKNLLVELGHCRVTSLQLSHQVKNNSVKKWQPSWMTTDFHTKTFKPSQHHAVLAVRVIGLADQQSDLTEDFKGPSKKIALDADGNFSKAAQGVRPWERFDG